MFKEIFKEYKKLIIGGIATALFTCTVNILTKDDVKDDEDNKGNTPVAQHVSVDIDEVKSDEERLDVILNKNNKYKIVWISLEKTENEAENNIKIQRLENIKNEVQEYAKIKQKNYFKDAEVRLTDDGKYFTIVAEENSNISLEDLSKLEEDYIDFIYNVNTNTSIHEKYGIGIEEKDYPNASVTNKKIEELISMIQSYIDGGSERDRIEIASYYLCKYIMKDTSNMYLKKYILYNKDMFIENLEIIKEDYDGSIELNPDKSYIEEKYKQYRIIEIVKNAKYIDSEVTINDKIEANKVGYDNSIYKYTWETKKVNDNIYVVWCKEINNNENKSRYIDIYEYNYEDYLITPITQNKGVVNKELDAKYRNLNIIG